MAPDPDEPEEEETFEFEDWAIQLPEIDDPDIDADPGPPPMVMPLDPNAPTLDLDFMAGTMPAGFTFARASTGTYYDFNGVLQTAAVNAPRFDYDPATKLLKGLLIEEQRTNMLLWSGDLTQTSGPGWGIAISSMTATVSTDLAPDGVSYMTRLAEAATNSSHYMQQAGKVTIANQIYTASFFAKPAQSRFLQVILDDANNGTYCTFDLLAGVITQGPVVRGTGSVYGATITPVGNGIYRCSVSASNPSTTTRFVFVMVNTSNAAYAPGYQGNAANGLSVWGAQLEADVVATSYIATTTATVTRSADNCTMATGAWFSATSSSLEIDCIMPQSTNLSASNTRTAVSISDGSTSNIIRVMAFLSATYAGLETTLASTPANGSSLGQVVGGGLSRIAGAWDGASMYGCLNGDTPTTDAAGMPSGLNVLTIGTSTIASGSLGRINGWARRVRYWPRALASAELVSNTGAPNGPSLDFDFTTPGQLPAVTFSRASAGTYFDATGVMQTAGPNVPRWDYDPVTHMLKGLLLESPRTNSSPQSTMFNSWGLVGTTHVATAALCPDGTTSATQLIEDTSTGSHFTGGPVVALAANAPITASCFAMMNSRQYVLFALYDNTTLANFAMMLVDLSNGAIGQTVIGGAATAVTFSVVNVGNGWFRLIVTATLSAAATSGALVHFNMSTAATTAGSNYTGDGASNLYCWGAQMEAGSFATSYIATLASSVGRSADVCQYPVGGWFNATQGSIAADFDSYALGTPAYDPFIVGLYQDTNINNMIELYVTPALQVVARVATGGGAFQYVVVLNAPVPASSSAISKIATTYQASVYSAGINGAGPQTNTSGPALPVSVAYLEMGTRYSGGISPLDGHMRRVRYWPRVLAPSEMVDLTSPTLDLDFTTTPGQLPPGVAFTRINTATYTDLAGIVRIAAAGVPRWDYDPNTLALKGLLIEEPRTNMFLWSSTPTSSSWAKWSVGTGTAPVVTANQTTAPDGTLTAASIVYPAVSGAGNASAIYQNPTMTAAVYTVSFYLKGAVGGEQLYLIANGAGFQSTRITLTTSWQRFTFTPTTLTASTWFWELGADMRDGTQTATPAQTIYMWGAQLELGAYASSYIPTTTAALARPLDIVTLPIGSWFNPATGSLAGDYIVPYASVYILASIPVVADLNDGTINNCITLRLGPPATVNNFPVIAGSAGTTGITIANGWHGANTINQAALTYDGPGLVGMVAANGAVASNAITGLPPGITRLSLGQGRATELGGTLRRVRYWPRVLAPTELVVTTGGTVPARVMVMA